MDIKQINEQIEDLNRELMITNYKISGRKPIKPWAYSMFVIALIGVFILAKPTLSGFVIKNENPSEIPNIDPTYEFEFKNSLGIYAYFYGVDNIKLLKDIQAFELANKSAETQTEKITFGTDVIFIPEFDMQSSEITMSKNIKINAIFRCIDWDHRQGVCKAWQKTNLQFEDRQLNVVFRTEQIGAYAAGYATPKI